MNHEKSQKKNTPAQGEKLTGAFGQQKIACGMKTCGFGNTGEND